jgi:hypothetical protein
MVIQFIDLKPEIIYFDNVDNLKKLNLRIWKVDLNKYEFDISLAKKSNPIPS